MSSSYYDKLRDPQWLLKRQEIMDTRGRKCEFCGNTDNLTVHHGYYRPKGDPWDYETGTLWLLCWPCHEQTQAEMIRLHQIIAHVHPRDLAQLHGRFDDVAFEVQHGISKEEFHDILDEERRAEASLYADYTVTLTSTSDLGATQAYYIEDEAYREFPGITVHIAEYKTGRDGVATVEGSDGKVTATIQGWFDKRMP